MFLMSEALLYPHTFAQCHTPFNGLKMFENPAYTRVE